MITPHLGQIKMIFYIKFDKNSASETATIENSKNYLTHDEINEILIKSGRTFKNLEWDFKE